MLWIEAVYGFIIAGHIIVMIIEIIVFAVKLLKESTDVDIFDLASPPSENPGRDHV